MLHTLISWLPARLAVNLLAAAALVATVSSVSRGVRASPIELADRGIRAVGIKSEALVGIHEFLVAGRNWVAMLVIALGGLAIATVCATATGVRWCHLTSPMLSWGTYAGAAAITTATEIAGRAGLLAAIATLCLVGASTARVQRDGGTAVFAFSPIYVPFVVVAEFLTARFLPTPPEWPGRA